MYIVSEAVCAEVFSRADAFRAVEAVFASMARDEARNFPVIREQLGYADAIYGFKSGFDRSGLSLGLKSGGYWPHNVSKGLTNHQSTVFLFDPDTGKLCALVAGNYLTAIRTAAASAVSIAHLARDDARVLGMLGAGHQSTFQLRAALEQRSFEKVMGWNLDSKDLEKLASVAQEAGLPFEAVERQQLGAEADVLITITSASDALLQNDWIHPGTHLACMGTDTVGKQEIDARLFSRAVVFTDEVAQAVTIGETQHAFSQGLVRESDLTPIGAVINGSHAGRSSPDDITIFDGTGVGLQDLAAASASLQAAIEQGKATEIEL